MRRAHLALFFVLVASLALTGCKSFLQKKAMDTTSDVLYRARIATQQESDIDVARAAIPASLKTVEGFHVANPDNPKLKEILAQGWCSYATGFLQDEWEVAKMEGRFDDAEKARHRASRMFLRCMNYGLKQLPGKWSDAIHGDIASVEKLLAKASKSQKRGLFWTAVGLGSAINMNRDDIAMVAHLPKAKMILEKIVEWDPGYQNGMALIALGMSNSARGTALGGEPEKGREYFERAVEVTEGKFLMAKVLQARTYAVITQNRELFRKLLIEVLTTDPAVYPDQRLANELAHHKARRYLKQEKDWF